MPERNETAQLLLNAQRLRVGAVLAVVGAVLGAIGSLVAGLEVAGATKKWLSESGYPPSDVARAKLHQAVIASRAASHAAFDAWQHNGGTTDAREIVSADT